MKKLTLFFILSTIAFAHGTEINSLFKAYYSGEGFSKAFDAVRNIKTSSNVEKRTIDNILSLLEIRKLDNKKIKYEKLTDLIKENTPLMSETDESYLISVAEIVGFIVGYSPVNEMVYYSSKMKELYEKIININPNNFDGLLGYSLWFFHAPSFIGGNLNKAFEYLNKAYLNASLDYQKYLAYVWYSQYYFKRKDNQNYERYVNLAKTIYPNGRFINDAIKQNTENKKSM